MNHVPKQNHDKICVDVTLVNLVDNDVRDSAESGLEFSEKDADGAKENCRKSS